MYPDARYLPTVCFHTVFVSDHCCDPGVLEGPVS